MKLLRPLYRLPIPQPIMLIPSLGMWCTWWLATRLDAVAFGMVISPLILAVFMKMVLRVWANANINLVFKSQWKSKRQNLIICMMLIFLALGVALWLNNPWLVQVGWSAALFVIGAIFLIFAIYDPTMMHDYKGLTEAQKPYSADAYAISAMVMILQAYIGAVLTRYGSEAAWVAYVSFGSVGFHMFKMATITTWITHKNDRINRT